MSKRTWIGIIGFVVAVSGLHLLLNVDWKDLLNDYRPKEKRKVVVAYIPVT